MNPDHSSRQKSLLSEDSKKNPEHHTLDRTSAGPSQSQQGATSPSSSQPQYSGDRASESTATSFNNQSGCRSDTAIDTRPQGKRVSEDTQLQDMLRRLQMLEELEHAKILTGRSLVGRRLEVMSQRSCHSIATCMSFLKILSTSVVVNVWCMCGMRVIQSHHSACHFLVITVGLGDISSSLQLLRSNRSYLLTYCQLLHVDLRLMRCISSVMKTGLIGSLLDPSVCFFFPLHNKGTGCDLL